MRFYLYVTLTATGSILFLYLNFAFVFLRSDTLSKTAALELAVFALQVGKVSVLGAVKRLRTLNFITVVDILGAELAALLPLLALDFVLTGSASVLGLMNQVFLGWTAGVIVAGVPFGIYRLAKSMASRGKLTVVLPSALVLSELAVLLLMGADELSSSGGGLGNLARDVLLGSSGIVGQGYYKADIPTLLVFVFLYISLILYALVPGEMPRRRFIGVLSLALFATLVTYGVAYAASQISVALVFFVLPSTLIASGTLWWTTHGV